MGNFVGVRSVWARGWQVWATRCSVVHACQCLVHARRAKLSMLEAEPPRRGVGFRGFLDFSARPGLECSVGEAHFRR